MAYEKFFRNDYVQETAFFDEGPEIRNVKPAPVTGSVYINTSSIDTSPVDPYRQGVELTQQKHFDAGLAKIHAGEPGHVLRRNRYGMDKNFRNDPRFEELDYFNPVQYIQVQAEYSPLLWDIITFPIITGDNDQIENYYFNGIIEPFPIREVASFFSIEVPFQARAVRGGIMDGNLDQTWASDRVVSVYKYEPDYQQIEYLDLVDMIDGQFPLNGFFRYDKAPIKPFADVRYVRNAEPPTTYAADMLAAVNLMSGSTENHVSFEEKSATCGWDYANTHRGTDSIAFGGQAY